MLQCVKLVVVAPSGTRATRSRCRCSNSMGPKDSGINLAGHKHCHCAEQEARSASPVLSLYKVTHTVA